MRRLDWWMYRLSNRLGPKAPVVDGAISLRRYRPDDAFLASYPRSGNTWMRYFLASYMAGGRDVTMRDIWSAIQDLHEVPERKLNRARSPRIMKTHLLPAAGYPRVIYLVRDPRAVAVSYYRFMRSRDTYAGGLREFVSDMIAGKIWPGSWRSHVERFQEAGKTIPVTWIRYEELIADPRPQLVNLLHGLGLPVSCDTLDRAIAHGSFDGYRRDITALRPHDQVAGSIQQWRGVLHPDDADQLIASANDLCTTLGYVDQTPV